MKITRTSMISGIERTKDIPVTYEQLIRWKEGELIQDVMSNISPSDREFIMSGITDDEWDELLKRRNSRGPKQS